MLQNVICTAQYTEDSGPPPAGSQLCRGQGRGDGVHICSRKQSTHSIPYLQNKIFLILPKSMFAISMQLASRFLIFIMFNLSTLLIIHINLIGIKVQLITYLKPVEQVGFRNGFPTIKKLRNQKTFFSRF